MHADRVSPPAPPQPLPQRLRVATRELHMAAERSGVMADLLRGRLPQPGYRALLLQLQALYGALEAALDAQATQPWLAGIDREALRRTPALGSDLAAAAATPAARGGGAGGPQLHTETLAYCQRLQALGAAADPALLGHVYTRYLGDLHGGQLLQALVQRAYPQQGTRFFEFGDEARVGALRAGLREALAGAPLSSAQADQVVAEACWSFQQHRRLFEALARTT